MYLYIFLYFSLFYLSWTLKLFHIYNSTSIQMFFKFVSTSRYHDMLVFCDCFVCDVKYKKKNFLVNSFVIYQFNVQ